MTERVGGRTASLRVGSQAATTSPLDRLFYRTRLELQSEWVGAELRSAVLASERGKLDWTRVQSSRDASLSQAWQDSNETLACAGSD